VVAGGGNNKEPGSILVATHSACDNISLYRVFISWSPPVWDPNQLRQPSGTHAFPVPTFRIVHNKIEKPSRVFTPNKSQNESGEELPSDVNALYSLTRLDIVPGPSESTGGATTGPWILAVYSSQTHAVRPELSQQGTPASVIARWQLEATTLSLHPVFEEVVSKKATVQAKVSRPLRESGDPYTQ
jgi:mediator of RNA polymerase II transcription subunit 16